MRKFRVLLTGEKSRLKNYVCALENQKLQPIFDPYADCDALILTGGGDVSPCFYGRSYQLAVDVDLYRDCLEQFLIKKYLSQRKAILGICRGMQMLAVYYGSTLYNLPNKNHSRAGEKHDKKHVNKSISGSFCQKLYGDYFATNSAHQQAVYKLSKSLKLSAKSLDGVIEAFENDSVLGVQFHPERMNQDFGVCGDKIFEYFKSKIIAY